MIYNGTSVKNKFLDHSASMYLSVSLPVFEARCTLVKVSYEPVTVGDTVIVWRNKSL